MAALVSDWLRHFDFSSETAERNSTKLDRKQHLNFPYQVCVFRADQKNEMVALASDWLRHFCTPVFRRDVLWYGDVRPGLHPSDSPSVRPSVRPGLRPSARFPHFSPTYVDILSRHFAHDFVLMYYRSSSTVVTLRQFLKELCLFVNLEYR